MSMQSQATGGALKVLGRYALYGEIAAGGMASVHIGRLLGPVGFARTVAIKRLHPQFAKDPEFVSMFLDEARLAARVQHPNVVATIDVVATDGELFLIMDYIRGESLSRMVKLAAAKGERVPARICAAIMCGFLHGLHAAHEAKDERGAPLNLVHRDVSPQNVLVGSDGTARVLDFGVAKAAGRIQVTRDGQIKGKLAYMPPEQLQGHELTRTVDIYASAVVLWETLTGGRLFKGDNEGETLQKILRGMVDAPSRLVPGLNPAFDAVVSRALAQTPEQRFPTAREMALALERCDGIASPTEVGEWVERIAGDVIQVREARVAEVESDSARHSVPGRAQLDSSPSDLSAPPQGFPRPPLPDPPSSRRIESTMVGVGPSSSPQFAAAPSSQRIFPTAPVSVGGPPRPVPAPDDPTVTGRSAAGTAMFPLPTDGRTPMVLLAAGLALVGLFALALLVVFRRADPPQVQAILPLSASVSPSAPMSAGAAPSASVATAVASVGAASVVAAPIAAKPVPTAAVAPASAKPLVPAATAPRPTATVVVSPPKPTGGKSCDPPYTLDAKGHKHYKLECMGN
jgi:eukaryotic-like serine/threonine-protein kinase